MTRILPDLLYSEDDEWIRVAGDEGTVGITDYAQDSLSDIVYLELPEVGAHFMAGESFGVVESVKAAADLYMPVSGEILEVNEGLLDAPELLNSDPYGAAWLVKINISEPAGLEKLMDAEAYEAYCEERS